MSVQVSRSRLIKFFFVARSQNSSVQTGRNQPEDEPEPSKIQLRETRVYLNIGTPKKKTAKFARAFPRVYKPTKV